MFKKWNQSSRLHFFSIGVIIMLLLTTMATVTSILSSKEADKTAEKRFALVTAAKQFSSASVDLTRHARSYASTLNTNFLDKYNREITEDKNREKAREIMNQYGINETEDTAMRTMEATSAHLADLETQAFAYAASGDSKNATALMYSDDYLSGEAEVQKQYKIFYDSIVNRTDKEMAGAIEIASATQILSIVLLIPSILFVLLMMLFVKKELMKPIIAIKETMTSLAEGHLSETKIDLPVNETEVGRTVAAIKGMNYRLKTIIQDLQNLLFAMADGNFRVESGCREMYVGEYGNIYNALDRIHSKLKETLQGIGVASTEVNSSAQEMSHGSEILAQGSAQQASSLEELSATVSTVSDQIKSNAANAESASDLSRITEEELKESSSEMNALSLSMNEINGTAQQISNIIQTIDDIAFQTNILALNAAVEAARAGESGKGFAVVADEVRNLAGKSAEAAKDTTVLIENTVRSIREGTEMADRAAASLEKLVKSSRQMNAKILEIAEYSGQQSNSVSEIAQGLEQISSVVQNNSATAAESAATSAKLSDQSKAMDTLLKQFTL